MASPRTGIFALGTGSHAYLEFDLVADVRPAVAVAQVAALRESRTTIGGVNLVTGFRPELWAAEPLRFAVFTETEGTVADLINRVFDPTITIADLAWLRDTWTGPIVIKGIQTIDDARLVVDAGADAIVVSNHGGRQLDRAPTPLEQSAGHRRRGWRPSRSIR